MQKIKEDKVIDEDGFTRNSILNSDTDVVICIRWPNGHLDDFAFKDYGVAQVYAEMIICSDPKFEEFRCTHVSPTNGSEYWTPNTAHEYFIMQPEDYLTVKPEATFIYEERCIRVGTIDTCVAIRDGLGIEPIFEDLGNGEFRFIGLPDDWVDTDD